MHTFVKFKLNMALRSLLSLNCVPKQLLVHLLLLQKQGS